MFSFYKNILLPKLFFIPYYLNFFMLKIVALFSKKDNIKNPTILISAGHRGWESIEFKEIFLSANEYLDNKGTVIKHVLIDNNNYIHEIMQLIRENKVTHVFYDPRTGFQTFWKAYFESLRLSIIFTFYNVTPIIYQTDISNRIWRLKGALISSYSGITICFLSSKLISPIFPNKRLFGPFLMPFSIKTLRHIENLRNNSQINNHKATFIGSLYEPRTTILNYVKSKLNEKELDLEILGRELGSKRKPDDFYWQHLINSNISFTTSEQQNDNKLLDYNFIPSLVYRYTEALACGSLLIAPIVPGVEKYFKPGIDFIGFRSIEESVEKIEYSLLNFDEVQIISNSGNKKVRQLIEAQSFWLQLDTCLATKSIL